MQNTIRLYQSETVMKIYSNMRLFSIGIWINKNPDE